MPSVLPSHIVSAIDSMFGPNRNELDMRAVKHIHKVQLHALLTMLEAVPHQLIDLNAPEYLALSRCRGALATSLPAWNLGDLAPANSVDGKDAVACIRRLMMQCHDQVPPPEPELPFITDDDTRLGMEDRIRSAWTNFHAREWMGATLFAGHVLEALLLWAVKQKSGTPSNADKLHLHDLIAEAAKHKLITQESKQQADLAKDARNLIHPGRANRSGSACTKATALTALTAVYRIADDLKSPI